MQQCSGGGSGDGGGGSSSMTLDVFLSPLKCIRHLCLAKLSVSATFVGDRDGDGDVTNGQIYGPTDFFWKIIFQIECLLWVMNLKCLCYVSFVTPGL